MQPGATPGAVLELHAAKASGGTAPGSNDPLTTEWYDTSGNGNHGTLVNFTGTPWSADRLAHDGNTGKYITTPLNADGLARSWEFWISNSKTTPLTRLCGGSTVQEIRLGSSKAPLLYLGGSNYRYWPAQDAAQDGALHHWVFTLPGTAQDAILSSAGYLDGGAMTPGSTNAGGPQTTFGLLNLLAAFPPVGAIALARVYPFVLTPEQVAQNYAVGLTWGGLPPHILRPVYLPQGIVL